MLQWNGLQGFDDEISLKSLSWDCRVHHLHCTLKSEQLYVNTSDSPVEAVYTFALPRSAVVTNFEIDVGGKHLKAQVARTEEAAERYEKALDEGDMPAMIEHDEDGLCTLNIGGIAPNEQVVIQITCEWMQERVGDVVRITIPTVVADRYSASGTQGKLLPHQYLESSAFAEYPIKAHFEFSGPEYESARFSAPGFSPACTFTDAGVVIDINHGFADRDLVVTAQNVRPVAYSWLLEDKEGYRGVAVLPVPKLGAAESNHPLRLGLVVDCSGSMVGAAIEEARRALSYLPKLLTEKDSVSVTLFGAEPRVVFKRPQACTKAFFRRDYLPCVEDIAADMGGTEMASALKAAAKTAAGDVLLITDGEIWETEECIKIAKSCGLRVFVIGIGNAANSEFCHAIAAATGGCAEMVLPTEDMTQAASRMIERMRRPALQVENFAPQHFEYRSNRLQQLHADETVIVYFRFSKLPGQVPMLELSDGKNRVRVTGAPWKMSEDRGLLMIAAHAELNDGAVEDPAEFAARYWLLSRWTNLILVNDRGPARQRAVKPVLQRIPQMKASFSLIKNLPHVFKRKDERPISTVSHLRHIPDDDDRSIKRARLYPEFLTCEAESDDRRQTRKDTPQALYSEDFLLAAQSSLAVFAFDDPQDRKSIESIANDLNKPKELIFFYYLLWREEVQQKPMPQILADFKDLPELQLDDAEKTSLWERFSKTFNHEAQ